MTVFVRGIATARHALENENFKPELQSRPVAGIPG